MLGSIFVHLQQPKPSAQLVQSYAVGVNVQADKIVANEADQTSELIGHVTATYGPTTLYADRMTLHNDPANPYAEAIGNIRIVDPEATANASYIKYFWKTHTGNARDVVIQASLIKIVAKSADLSPKLWTFHDVGGTGCKLRTPLYYMNTREMRVEPGVKAIVVHPQLSILGRRLVTLPTEHYSFSGPTNSIDLPYPTIRTGKGFGLNWKNQFDIDNQTGLFTKYAVFSKASPFYNATVIRSLIPGREAEPLRTEIGDRFSFGYFDDVMVRDPKAEQQSLRAKRFELGISSTYGADARDTTTSSAKIDKPVEALAQVSGAAGGFSLLGLAREQQIRVGGGERFSRLITEENVLSPFLSLGKNLIGYGRLDMAQFTGGQDYNWFRGQVGVDYQATKVVRLGLSYTAAKANGTPDFAYDVPLRFHEIGLRTDFDFDTTQFRILLKYDPSDRSLFDREFYVSRVVGCVEPYVVYREKPHKFFLGIRIPLTRVFQQIDEVAEQRRAAIRTVISGPPP